MVLIEHLGPMKKPMGWDFRWEPNRGLRPPPPTTPFQKARKKSHRAREELTFPAEHGAVIEQEPRDNGQAQQEEAHDGSHDAHDVQGLCKDKSHC